MQSASTQTSAAAFGPKSIAPRPSMLVITLALIVFIDSGKQICSQEAVSMPTPLTNSSQAGSGIDFASLHFFSNSLKMEFVRLPPGEFIMGNSEPVQQLRSQFPKTPAEDYADERPIKVQITQPYFLATREVTLGDFLKYYHDDAEAHKTDAERDGAGGRGFSSMDKIQQKPAYVAWNTGWNIPSQNFMDHPVVNVSWNDAMRFCRWLTERERATGAISQDQEYTLPTEAQWEYAGRAGSLGRYWFGEDPEKLAQNENVGDRSLARKGFGDTLNSDDHFVFSSPVGSFPPNPWGLYDMLGNVREWCRDYKLDNWSQVVEEQQAPNNTSKKSDQHPLLLKDPLIGIKQVAGLLPRAGLINIREMMLRGTASVEPPAMDIGPIMNLFDNQASTLIRTAQVNPAVITLAFATAQSIKTSRVQFSHSTGNPAFRYSIEVAQTLTDLDKREGSYQRLCERRGAQSDEYDEITFDQVVTAEFVRLTVTRLTGDDYIHMNEWQLIGDPATDQIQDELLMRAIRGGSWLMQASNCRVSERGGGSEPAWRDQHIGFRVALISNSTSASPDPEMQPSAAQTLAGDIVIATEKSLLWSDIAGQPGGPTSKLPTRTQLRVHAQKSPWLLVSAHSSSDEKKWIHRNDIFLRAGHSPESRNPQLDIAVIKDKIKIISDDPLQQMRLLMNFQIAIGTYLENGQATDLVNSAGSLSAFVERIPRRPLGNLFRASLLGLLGDANRLLDRTSTAIDLTRQGSELLLQEVRQTRSRAISFATDRERDEYLSSASIMLGQFAWALSKYGRLSDAEVYAREAAEALREVRLAWNNDVSTLDQYAEILIKRGKSTDAPSWLELSSNIHERFRNPAFHFRSSNADPGLTDNLKSLCYTLGGSHKNATDAMHLSQKRYHQYLSDHRRIEHPALEFILRDASDDPSREAFDHAISLAFGNSALGAATAPSLGATWVMNRKYKLEETLQKRMEALHGTEPYEEAAEALKTITSNLPVTMKYLAEPESIHSLRGMLAEMRLREYSPEELDAAQQEFETMRLLSTAAMSTRVQTVSGLTNSFSSAGGPDYLNLLLETHAEQVESQWIEASQLQHHLSDGQVLVDYVKYRPFDYAAAKRGQYAWQPERYGAFVITSQGEIQQHDLGAAEEVDKIISNALKSIDERKLSTTTENEKSLEKLFPELRELSRVLLEPIRQPLNERREVIFSPDGNLWLVPWSALLWNSKEFLIEHIKIRQIRTARYLAIDKNSVCAPFRKKSGWIAPKQGNPLILADPDYDASSDSLDGSPKVTSKSEHPLQIGFEHRGKTLLPQFSRLLYTRYEAESIKPSIEAYCGVPAKMLLGEQAREHELNQGTSPRILVLSTHGFFLQSDKTPSGKSSIKCRDPLMRAGLMLAGCNHINSAKNTHGLDGLLTGYEVATLDLRKTELVVLSACETGLGDIRNAEGAVGMRQAFFVAGAQNVLASIWQVPDKDTAMIINQFFTKLSEGLPYGEALREAQLSQMRSARQESGIAQPYFWAGLAVAE